MTKELIIEASITLLLREQDLKLLIRAMRSYTPTNEEEAHNRDYLLDVLETIDISD